MKKIFFSFVVFSALTLLKSCATYTSIDPVGKKKIRINGSIGGPFFTSFGYPIPVPYATAGITYGLTNISNLVADLHLTPYPYRTIGLSVSYAWFPVLNDSAFIPNVSIQPSMIASFNIGSSEIINHRALVIPTLSSAVSWKLWIGTIYAGMDMTLSASLTPPFRQPNDPNADWVIFSPFFGYRWNLTEHWKLITEIKFQAVNVLTHQIPIRYVNFNRHGVLTVYIGVQYDL